MRVLVFAIACLAGFAILMAPARAQDVVINELMVNNVPTVEIQFSREPGWYPATVEVALSTDDGYDIRYTLDGSNPTPQSLLYTDALSLGDRRGEPNVYAAINPTRFGSFRPPDSQLTKINVVKAQAFDGDDPVGPVRFNSYLIHPDEAARYAIHVVSLAVEPEAFFGDESGIYVPGDRLDSRADTANYNHRGREWERRASLQLFDGQAELQLDQDVGVRIHGGSTRADTQKSLRLYARDDYGADKLEYQFFANRNFDDYKRILLRQSNSAGRSLFREPMAHQLASGAMDIGVMEAIPAAVFLNGEYWGIYHLRDRLDDRYVEYRFGVDRDRIDYWEGYPGTIANVEEGTNDAYLALEDFLLDPATHLSSDADYATFAAAVDVPSFIDYIIAETFLANRDWPDNNVEAWRDQVDGQIRFLLKDLDSAMLGREWDSLSRLSNPGAYYTMPVSVTPAFFFSNAIYNKAFVRQFLARYEFHINSTFATARVNAQIDERVETYVALYAEHLARYNLSDTDEFWRQYSSNGMKDFFLQRRCVVRTQLFDLFGVVIKVPECTTGAVRVALAGNGVGQVDGADARIQCGVVCTASYSDGARVTLSARASTGSEFVGWDGCSAARDSICTVLADQMGTAVTARFGVVGVPNDEVVVDDAQATLSGIWMASFGENPWLGRSVFSQSTTDVGRFAATLPAAGSYEVYAWWTYHPNRSTGVPYRVRHTGGDSEVVVNQRDHSLGGRWNPLGVYRFDGDASAVVEVLGRNGQASADAVRFVPIVRRQPSEVVPDPPSPGTGGSGEPPGEFDLNPGDGPEDDVSRNIGPASAAALLFLLLTE